MYVYKTTNKVNGKIYIGISKRTSENSKDYLGSGKLLKRAVRKYGRENFYKEIIVESIFFKYPDLQALERYFIKEYDSTNLEVGYNISEGGDGNSGKANGMYGKTHTKETVHKILKTKLKKKALDPNYGVLTEEARKRKSKLMSQRNKENPTLPNGHSEETKKQISETLLRKYANGEIKLNPKPFSKERKEEYSKKFSGKNNPFYGKKHSDETKEKIKKAIRDRMPGVIRISLDYEPNKIYENIQDVKEDGFRIDLVRRVCRGQNSHHKGYCWKFLNKDKK